MSSPLDLSDLEAEAFGKPKAPEPALDLGDLEAEAFGKTAAPEPALDLSDLEAEAFGRQDLGRELGLAPDPGSTQADAPRPITLAEIERTPGEKLGLHRDEDPYVVDLVSQQGINVDVARTMATEGVDTESEARRILNRKGSPAPVLSPGARLKHAEESAQRRQQPVRDKQLRTLAESVEDPLSRAAMHVTSNDKERRVLEDVWGPMSGEGAAKFIMLRAYQNLARKAVDRAQTPSLGLTEEVTVTKDWSGDPVSVVRDVKSAKGEWGGERGFLGLKEVEKELYTAMLASAYARKKIDPLEYIFAQIIPEDGKRAKEISKRLLTYKRIAEVNAAEQHPKIANDPTFHELRKQTDIMFDARRRGMVPFRPMRQFAKWIGDGGPVVGPALATQSVYFTNNEAEARNWLANQSTLEEESWHGRHTDNMADRRSLLMAVSESASVVFLVLGNMAKDGVEMYKGIAGSHEGYNVDPVGMAKRWYSGTAEHVRGVPVTDTRQSAVPGMRGGRFLTPREFHVMAGESWERNREALESIKLDQHRRREFRGFLQAEEDHRNGLISAGALELKRQLYEDEFSMTTRGAGRLEGIFLDTIPNPGRMMMGTWGEAKGILTGMVPMTVSAAHTAFGPKSLVDKWGATAKVSVDTGTHIAHRYKSWMTHGSAHMLEKGLIGAAVDILLPFQFARAAVAPISRHFLREAQMAMYAEAGINVAGKTLQQVVKEAVERGINPSRMDPYKLMGIVEDGDLWLNARIAEQRGKAAQFRAAEQAAQLKVSVSASKLESSLAKAKALRREAAATEKSIAKVKQREFDTGRDVAAGKPISKADRNLRRELGSVEKEMAKIEARIGADVYENNPLNIRPEYRAEYRKAMNTKKRNLSDAEALERKTKRDIRGEVQALSERAERLLEPIVGKPQTKSWVAAESRKLLLQEELSVALANEMRILSDLRFRGEAGAIKPKGGPQRQDVQSVQRGLDRARSEVNRIAEEISVIEERLAGKSFEKIYDALGSMEKSGKMSFDVKGQAQKLRMESQRQQYVVEAERTKMLIERGSRAADIEQVSLLKRRQKAIGEEIKQIVAKSMMDDAAELVKLDNRRTWMRGELAKFETQAAKLADALSEAKERLKSVRANAELMEESHRALAKSRMYTIETRRATHILGPSKGEYVVRAGAQAGMVVPRRIRLKRTAEPAAPRFELHIEGKPGTIKRVGLFKSQAYKRTRSPLERALDRHDLWDALEQAIELGGQFVNPLYGGFSLVNAIKNRLIKGYGYLGAGPVKVQKHQLRWLLKDVDNVVPELVFAELRKAQGAVTSLEFELGEHLADLHRQARRTKDAGLTEWVRQVLHFESEAVVQSMEIVGFRRRIVDTDAMAALSNAERAALRKPIMKTVVEPKKGVNGYIQYRVKLPQGIVAEFDDAGRVIPDSVKLDKRVLDGEASIAAARTGPAGPTETAGFITRINVYNSRLETFKSQLPALNGRVASANKWAAPMATIIRDTVTRLGLSEGLFYAPGAIRGRLWMPNSYIHGGLEGLSDAITNRVRGSALKNNQLRRLGVPIEIRELPLGAKPWAQAKSEYWNRLLEKIPDKGLRERVRRDGGYGMNTDLAHDLLAAVPEAMKDFAYHKAYRLIAESPSVFTTVKAVAESRGWVKMSDVIDPLTGTKGFAARATGHGRRAPKKGPGIDRRLQAAESELEAAKLINSPFGKLSEGWVAPEVAEFLTQAERASKARFNLIDASTYGPALVGMWKGFKTIYSVATHTTNFLSNALFLAPIAGLSPVNPANWSFIARAGKEMLLGSKSSLYKDFVNYGGKGLRGGPQRSEIARAAEQAQASMYSGMMGRSKYFLEDIMMTNRNIVGGRKTGYGRLDQFVRRHGADNFAMLYQAGDDFWRFGLFLKLRQEFLRKNVKGKGLTGAERAALVEEANILAVKEARKAFADYENLAGWAQVNRNSVFGMPFLSFEVRSAPRVKKWIVERPWEAEGWLAFYDSMSHYNLAEAGVSLKAVDEFYKNLPWYEAPVMQVWAAVDPDNGWIAEWDGEQRDRKGALMLAESGWQKKIVARNLVKYAPNIRFLPLPYEAEEHGWDSFADAGKRALLGGSPILASFINVAQNYDFFYNKKLSPDDLKMLMAHRWLPNIPVIPKSYGHDRIEAARNREPRGLRDMPESVSQAQMASWWGIRDIAYSIGQLRKVGSANIWRQTKPLMDKLREIEKKAEDKIASIQSIVSPVRMQFEATDINEGTVGDEINKARRSFPKLQRKYKSLMKKFAKRGKLIEHVEHGDVELQREELQEDMVRAKTIMLAMYELAGLEVQREALPVLDALMGVYQSKMEELGLHNLQAYIQDDGGRLKQPKMRNVQD